MSSLAKSDKSPRVLLVWELGEGMGHAQRLLTLVALLQRIGCHCEVFVRYPGTLAEAFRQAGIWVNQAPEHVNCYKATGRFQARDYGDMMGVCGYADIHSLQAIVQRWDEILDSVKPDLVIADYSPLVSLAAFGKVPVWVIGDGFVVPATRANGDFVTWNPSVSPVWNRELLLKNAQRVQKQRKQRQPVTLSQVACGDRQIITVPKDLDTVANHRKKAHYIGLSKLETLMRPLPLSADSSSDIGQLSTQPNKRIVLIYLRANYHDLCSLIKCVCNTEFQCVAYISDASKALLAELSGMGALISHQPLPMLGMLDSAVAVIHHGGIGTLEQAWHRHVPQIIVPRHIEQKMNARMLLSSRPETLVLSSNTSLEKIPGWLNHLARVSAPTDNVRETWRPGEELIQKAHQNISQWLAEDLSINL